MKQPSLRISDRNRTAITPDGRRIPVVDGKFDILVQPNRADIDNGIKGDHANCMYCLACRRMYESTLVWVTRTLAYVEIKVRGGKSELHRFVLRAPAQLNIKNFDAGKDVMPEAVIFGAPIGSNSLESKTAAYKRRVSGKVKSLGKAYVVGKISGKPRKIPEPAFSALRNRATGQFQFKHTD